MLFADEMTHSAPLWNLGFRWSELHRKDRPPGYRRSTGNKGVPLSECSCMCIRNFYSPPLILKGDWLTIFRKIPGLWEKWNRRIILTLK